jgi:hypothetical protein
VERGAQPRRIDGFEQIVERVELKRLHRELVVGGGKDHPRRRRFERFEQLQAGLARHLHIKNCEVWFVFGC